MNKGISKNSVWLVWLAGMIMAPAQEPPVEPIQESGQAQDAAIQLESQKPLRRNQVFVGYRLGINMAVDFKGMGGFAAQSDPGPATGGGVDRFYDDGFNRVDSSGNSGGLTWYWGYNSSAQVSGTDSLSMNSSSSSERSNKLDVDEDLSHGPEITYRRDMNQLWKGRWGVEGSFAYNRVDVDNHSTFNNRVTTVSDSFALDGVIAPQPPYQGTFLGPGPVISDSPTRNTTVATTGALVVGKREMDSDLFNFRLGPYWEAPLHERVAASLSAGLAFSIVHSEFSFRETVTITGVGSQTRSASDSQTDLVVGGYVAGTMTYQLSERWDLYGSVQYVNLGHYEQSDAGRRAVIDFDDSIYFSLGAAFRF